MVVSKIDAFLLRDVNHGGPPDQAITIATKLAEFISAATTTLDLAIYDFRLTKQELADTVVGALTTAASNGVTVRIAFDAGKPAAATTATFALLAADPAPIGTRKWVTDHFAGTQVHTKAITAPAGQLMHSKYVIRDGEAVWTGSANWTDDAWTLQENNIITVASVELATYYTRDFDDLWAAGSIKATGNGDGGSTDVDTVLVGWDFAPGDGQAIDDVLTAAVTGATQRIVLATMVLTSHVLMAALVDAIGRGVPLSGIYDSGQMGPIEKEWGKFPSSAGTLAHWTTLKVHLVAKKSAPYKDTSPHNFMHNKVLIADNQLITGSYNFSSNAEKNAENQLRFNTDDALVAQYADYVSAIVAAYS